MRKSWTDERLDDRFDGIDRRFDEVGRRFDVLEHRFDVLEYRFDRLDARFDALQRTMIQVSGGVVAALVAGFAGVIATQL